MNRDFNEKEYTAVEQEVWDLLKKMQEKSPLSHTEEEEQPTNEKILPELPDTPDVNFTDVPLLFPFESKEPNFAGVTAIAEPQTEEEEPPRTFSKRLRGIFPTKTDTVGEVIRKCVFLVCLPVFIASLCFLSYYMLIEPRQIETNNKQYMSLYTEQSVNTTPDTDTNIYPDGMQASFYQLYDVNPDVAGWLNFTSNNTEAFLDINLPVVHCDNNDTYLSRSFDGQKSRSGTLFFDASNRIAKDADNKVSIIYGHNMASGAMFAGLNKLVDNIYRARAATLISLHTLYEMQYYQVFAVLVCDEDATGDTYFPYLRTSFNSETEFLDYVRNLRARSMYDYPVTVSGDDQLLILSTCTNKSQVKIDNGRLVVVARRVKTGENAQMNINKILRNEDMIMPYAWYTAQQLSPHAYYTNKNYTIANEDNVVPATTVPATDTTESSTTPPTAADSQTTQTEGTTT